jgi:hypothetical protein
LLHDRRFKVAKKSGLLVMMRGAVSAPKVGIGGVWLALALLGACGDDTTGATAASGSTGGSSTADGSTSGVTPTTGATTGSTGGSGSDGETQATTGSTTDATTGTTTTDTTGTTTDASTGTTTTTTDASTGSTGDGELCGDGVDDDGDGDIDEGCPCAADETQACFPFPSPGIGECKAGLQTCDGGGWGPCEGAVGPQEDVCDGLDNNCDDAIDETCVCTEGEVGACYPGPEGTQDVGICKSGMQTCVVTDGVAMWSDCQDFVLPEPDDECNDKVDNDCDGLVDVQTASLGVCTDQPVVAATICTADQLKPDLGGLTKQTFSFTKVDQAFVVPPGVTSIWVKLWGAGGGSWNAQQGGPGGGGGFALAKLTVDPGEQLTVIVGERGEDSFSQTMIYGGGGHGGLFAGNGGGRSAIRRGATELATAAAGGGAGGCNVMQPCPGGGAGGGALGEDGEDPPLGDMTFGTRGFGATQTCGGAGGTTTCGCTLQAGMGGGGSQFQGGVTVMAATGQGGGGGGGGWFGGGSGGGDCALNTGGSGGGGSSHVDPMAGCVVAGAGMTAANNTDPDYQAGVGNGGAPGNDGNHGLVVIYH